MKGLLVRLIRQDEGQDLIEYALLGGFISLASIAGITLVGTNLSTWYRGVGTLVGTITPAGT